MTETIVMTGKEKKAQRRGNKEGLPSYYVFVVNDRTHSTQLVSRDKAQDYTEGKINQIGIRVHNLKDTYHVKEIHG